MANAPVPNVVVHALGLVAALGAAVFGTVVRSRSSIVALVVGFVVGLWTSPSPGWTGILVAAGVGLGLSGRGGLLVEAGLAGWLGGLWATVLHDVGLAFVAACALALSVPVVSAWMTHREPEFAPRAMQEEALVLVGAFALAVAAAPDVVNGWRSARVINLDPGVSAVGLHGWILVVGGALAALGGVHTLWRRR